MQAMSNASAMKCFVTLKQLLASLYLVSLNKNVVKHKDPCFNDSQTFP